MIRAELRMTRKGSGVRVPHGPLRLSRSGAHAVALASDATSCSPKCSRKKALPPRKLLPERRETRREADDALAADRTGAVVRSTVEGSGYLLRHAHAPRVDDELAKPERAPVDSARGQERVV